MASVTVLPLAVYPANTYQIPEADIADDVTEVRAAFQRCTSADPTVWPLASTTISYDFDVSVNGAPYQDFIAGSDPGGLVTSPKTGIELAWSDLGDNLPPGINRKIRGTVTTSASIKTSAVVTVT